MGRGQPIVVRISTEGTVALLPTSRTSHVDSIAPEVLQVCYLVVAVAADGRLLALSDFLCVMPGAATGFAPRNFTLQLNQSLLATLGWEPATGATSYILLPVGSERLQLLPATSTGATDPTGGRPTCYVLIAQVGTSTSGISAVLCGFPGIAVDLAAGQRPVLPAVGTVRRGNP